MSIQEQVDLLIDTRGGKELLAHNYDNVAIEIEPGFIFQSNGATAAYMIVTAAGRVIVNTGMGYEALHHKRLFDMACPGPTPYIITTQAHVDHVGGVHLFRGPETKYVAQANNQACQADDARIQALRMSTAQIWFDISGTVIRRFIKENPGVAVIQDRPVPDLSFNDRMALRVGELDIELLATTGETIDSLTVWLPQHRTALVSNLFGPLFPHFPNLNTLRGDRYRFVEPYLASVRRVRELQLETLIVGRSTPIRGKALIDAALARLHDAVEYVHYETLERINKGIDIDTIVHEVTLPANLRVGQGYAKVAWGVRTIWESYVGWFRLQSSTEMYPVDPRTTLSALVANIGAPTALQLARTQLADGQTVQALHLAEAVLANSAHDVEAAAVAVQAHDMLIEHGDESFWESGYLRHQRGRYQHIIDSQTS